jgi:SNF2-related domain
MIGWRAPGAIPELPSPLADVGPLRPYQAAGAALCRARRGTVLGWEMRIGKTPTALWAHDPADGPLLVVGPLSSRMVWVDWFSRRWPDVVPHLVDGHIRDRDGFLRSPVTFCHYEVLGWHQSAGLRPGTLIFDESHYLSNPRSGRTQAAVLFAALAQRVVCLTGTPKWNTALGLWAQFAACEPGAWGRWWDFARRYAGPIETSHGVKFSGVSNAEELRARTSGLLHILRRSDVTDQIPQVTRSAELVPLRAAALRDLEDALAEDLAGTRRRRAAIGDQSAYRKHCGLAKIKAATEIARQALAEGSPVILWVHHRVVGRKLAAGLPGAALVTGDVSVAEREVRIRAWRDDPEPRPIVISMPVGQVAIDLSRPGRLVREIFVEIDYVPAVVEQAEARPLGGSDPVDVVYLSIDHPVERAMVEMLVKKTRDDEVLGLPSVGTAHAIARALAPSAEVADIARLARIFDGA